MQYAVLLYDDERKWQDMTEEDGEELMAQHGRFAERVAELGGRVVLGEELQPVATARSVRWKGDEVTVSEGPFAETTEQFGGFYVVDLPDLDAAIETAKLLPHDIELRPTVVHEGAGGADGTPPEVSGEVFAVLLYGNEETWLRATPAERDEMYARHGSFASGVFERGAAVAGGEELAHSSNATTLRRIDGEVVVSDGPFAETAEQLTGFYTVKASDAAAVVELLDRLPGEVTEIRPTINHG